MKPLSPSRFFFASILLVVLLLTSPLWFGIPSWLFVGVNFLLGAMVLAQYKRSGHF